ncbi:prepilin-type cleavage/methylation domain-containing protein [Lelliottia sp. AC1]|jgi:prepilin peptidase dependent protein B|uniref:prepilin peptidase-dependent protein n=1 Tax=Lelliottia TaxID=1330545 RepID=UPI00200DF641|nr:MULTISPECIES: prepilin peptidase-dependent protein [Lelliottia]MDH6631449.1 prepilin peptidase dependent protein B [Lelliottia amnigena]UQC72385.1 prepilin-type cleavage/methylation domain-containing protein [Lelliottia sp. AC1]
MLKNQCGFSLTEVLIAMAISSILLLSTARFMPALQRAILKQEQQQELEEEVWLRATAIGKQLQRAGYCNGSCQGPALTMGRAGRCVIVQWDANSNGRWENAPSTEAEQTGFRLEAGALETQRGATSCEGKGWEKLTEPERVLVTHFLVSKIEHTGFAPELSIELAVSTTHPHAEPIQVTHRVTGFNL